MKVFDSAKHLIEQVRHSLVVQIHVDHLTQVRVHQLHDDVQVEELLQRLLRRERVQQPDDILVVDQLHQLELPVGSFGVSHVLEGPTQLLDGHVLLGDAVVGGADDALGAGPDGLEVLVAFEDGESRVADLDGVEV